MTEGRGAPRPYRVSVVGGSRADAREIALAHALGQALAESGCVVICGGRGGVMEAVARGASEAGGLTLGILPGDDPALSNPWIALPVATGLGDARNALVAGSGEAVVAVGGSWGTLSEVALALKKGRPVATLGPSRPAALDLPAFQDPAQAAAWAVDAARRGRGEKSLPGSVV